MNAITNFLASILTFFYENMSGGSYAVAIILFTLVIKLVILPLDVKSRKSMRRMSSVQPKITELQTRYKNDPEKLNQKTMELYKKERVSPMGGCLPMLLQFPVLICMWQALRAIANEQTLLMFMQVQQGVDFTAPDFLHSFFWIRNFWQPDSFTQAGSIIPLANAVSLIQPVGGNALLTQANIANMHRNYMQIMQGPIDFYNNTFTNGLGILPVLVLVSQVFTQKLLAKQNPQPATTNPNGNMMKSMNTIMPIVFFFICWGYSSAFSLYFAISNIYSLAQNVLLNRYLDNKEKPNQAGGVTTT